MRSLSDQKKAHEQRMNVTEAIIHYINDLQCLLISDSGEHLCCFQVWENKIEFITGSDWESFRWALGLSPEEALKKYEEKTKNETEERERQHKKLLSSMAKRDKKYEAMSQEQARWKSENWVCMEGGDGHYDMNGFNAHMREWERNYDLNDLTPKQKEQLESEYHALRLRMEERYRREQESNVRYWEDKTNDDVN